METLIPLIPALPLAGFAFTALFGRRLGKRASTVPVVLVVAAWLIAMVVAVNALSGQAAFAEGHGASVRLWNWIPAGAFHVDFGFYVDNLTACLLIVVT